MRVTSRSPLINVMVRAAEKAGRGLVRDFGEVEQLQVSRKGPADFVSQADLRAEQTLHEELQRVRPDFGFLMEEAGERAGSGTERWIIDPLDGTTNFLHGIPHWAISIAAERAGEIVAGVVYDPAKNELFWAERGGGAYLNDRRLRVAGRRDLPSALIGTGIPFLGVGDHPKYLKTLEQVIAQTSGVRRNGAAALDLAWVAAGRFDGFWEYGLKPWDVAAGVLIIREAGGFVTEISGGQNPVYGGSILAGNDAMVKLLAPLVGGG